MDSFGDLVSNMYKLAISDIATRYRTSQYYTFRNPEKILQLQKQLLHSKLESQIQFKSLEKQEPQECIQGLEQYKARIGQQKDKRELLRVAAGAYHLYFRRYVLLFQPKYGFNSRNGGIRTGNRYASDVINALLN
jgi:CRISPR/Cas system-associated endonuclease Cas1